MNPTVAGLLRTNGFALPEKDEQFCAPLATLVEMAAVHGHAFDLTAYAAGDRRGGDEVMIEDFDCRVPFPAMWFEWPSASGLEARGCLLGDLTDRLDSNDDHPLFDEPVWAAMLDARDAFTGAVGTVLHFMHFIARFDRVIGPAAWLVLVLDETGHTVGNRWGCHPGLTPDWVLANSLPIMRFLDDLNRPDRLQVIGSTIDGLKPARGLR